MEDISVGSDQIMHQEIANNSALGVDEKRKKKKESTAANKGKDAAESKVIKEDVQELEEPEEQSEESETDESELELTYLEEGTQTDQSGSDESETDEDDDESSSISSQILYLCDEENDETNTVMDEEVEKQETPGDNEETTNAAKDTLQSRSVLNFAKEEFVCELNVEPRLDDDKKILSIEYHKGSSARDLSTIDIRDVARDILKSCCSNCSPKVTIDEQLREDIATDLNEAILRPSKESGSEIDLIILLLVPTVVINVKSGAICGYGIGQLVAYGKNYSKRSKIFRGYAKNVETFQNIFKIINKTLN